MWTLKILHTDFYHLFYYFFIYSFLGWAMETCLVSASGKKFVNRGFLNGPFCPIYGIGASCVYLFLTPAANNVLLIFAGGMCLATVIEYVTATFMEFLFHAKWWDYSDKKYNLKGRVCLSISVCWGFLSVLMLKVFQPFILIIVGKIPVEAGRAFGSLLIFYFLGDMMLTTYHVLHLNSKLKRASEFREQLWERLENTKLYETQEEIRYKLEAMSKNELLDELKDRVELQISKYREAKLENYMEFNEKLERIQEEIRKAADKYQKSVNTNNIFEKRLMKAFPNIRSFHYEEVMKEMKKRSMAKKEKLEKKENGDVKTNEKQS